MKHTCQPRGIWAWVMVSLLCGLLAVGGVSTAQAGTREEPCPHCGDTTSGYNYLYRKARGFDHAKNCIDCEYDVTLPIPCTLNAATCTEPPTCIYCHESRDGAVPLGHAFETLVSTTATCTAAGQSTYKCIRCDVTQTRDAGALGHAYQATRTAPTCTAQGYTTHACIRGDSTYTDSFTPALGHNHKATRTAATCTAQGYTTHVCIRGDSAFTDTIVPALGHAMRHDPRRSRPAACGQAGQDAYTCARCGMYADTVLRALVHWYGTWAPAGEDGHSALCRRCGLEHAALCALTTARVDGKEITVCTVCGRGSEGQALEGASYLPVRRGNAPGNADLVVYPIALPEGEEGALYTIGLETGGNPAVLEGEVRITLPAPGEGAYEVYQLGADGGRTSIPMKQNAGTLVFDIAQPGLYLLQAAK